jgi:hypothetical protein
VKQLTKSVIEPPAYEQGLPVDSATDRNLIEWRDELEETIRQSPITRDVNDELVALDAAITEAAAIAKRFGTSGAEAQLRYLEERRADLAELEHCRFDWIEDNGGLLHRYSAVAEELRQRIHARTLEYEVNPPFDLVLAIGPKPDDPTRLRHWEEVAARYAEARFGRGNDPLEVGLKNLSASRYLDAAREYIEAPLQESGPLLKFAG